MTRSDLIEAMARAVFEDRNRGLRNCHAWDSSGLDDEHPGARDRYLREATAAISALASTIPGGEAALMALVNGEAVAVPRVLTEVQETLFEDEDGPCGPSAGCCNIGASEAQEVLGLLIRSAPYAAKEGRDG